MQTSVKPREMMPIVSKGQSRKELDLLSTKSLDETVRITAEEDVRISVKSTREIERLWIGAETYAHQAVTVFPR